MKTNHAISFCLALIVSFSLFSCAKEETKIQEEVGSEALILNSQADRYRYKIFVTSTESIEFALNVMYKGSIRNLVVSEQLDYIQYTDSKGKLSKKDFSAFDDFFENLSLNERLPLALAIRKLGTDEPSYEVPNPSLFPDLISVYEGEDDADPAEARCTIVGTNGGGVRAGFSACMDVSCPDVLVMENFNCTTVSLGGDNITVCSGGC